MIAAVVFDFDGVLADTERLHLEAFAEVFAARGWVLDERAYFDRYIGFDDRGTVRAFAADRGAPLSEADIDDLGGRKARVFARHLASSDVLYPGAAACVAALSGRFRLAIASGALRAEIEMILATGHLRSAFPVIVSADDVGASKPSPAPYLAAAAGLGVPPTQCVAVEDTRFGLASARAAGMKTIAVPTTTSPRLLAEADLVIERLADLTSDLVGGLDASRRP